ncbi:flagellar hook-associated protein FlgK [Methylobacterium segetis]|uniref:flagellar hook-associated protein FlgK n=1 Tax=Methylobacterium segetis TaxID=2488750 RepID=UPI001043C8C3|nr:flagellar hook-associated protein FlgK [Methylobacterium segetis]
MSVNALGTATAGLQAMQAAIGIVSQNVANAGTAGYVRRTLTPVSMGAGNNGVAVGTVARTFDEAALKQLRLETAGAAYTSVKADVISQIDKLYGTPGSSTALDGILNTFTQALQTLAANTNSTAARTTVVQTAATLAGQIGSIANSVQELRSGVESRLGTETRAASDLLSSIADLNIKATSTSDDATRAAILDQRDQQITQLSSYFDVKTVAQRDGTVSVLTTSGVTLVDRGLSATLTFDGRGTLDAKAAYASDPSKRGVGTITATTPGGAVIDLGEPGTLRSGTLAAEFELRDTILPQAQRQLDDLAGGLARALTDQTVSATASAGVTPAQADLDLTGIKPGNTVTVPIQQNGVVRNVILIASGVGTPNVDPAQTADPTALVQTFDISGGPSTYGASLQTALSALSGRVSPALDITATGVSGGRVRFESPGTWQVASASAGITKPASASDVSSGFPYIPLFVDGTSSLVTGSFDAGSQLTGLAQRLAVNPAVANNTASLVAGSATSTSPDTVRPLFLYDALTSAKQTFSAASGIGGIDAPHSASVVGFTQDIIAAQGAASVNARNLDEGQGVALATAQGRFSSSAGVNIDEEMSRLIELQTAYTANARVLTAARDMLDTLLRI